MYHYNRGSTHNYLIYVVENRKFKTQIGNIPNHKDKYEQGCYMNKLIDFFAITLMLEFVYVTIVGKYFESAKDFINLMKVCKLYKDILLVYHFNPISDTSLFENLETQYLYSELDVPMPNINHVHFEPVSYDTFRYGVIRATDKYKNIFVRPEYFHLINTDRTDLVYKALRFNSYCKTVEETDCDEIIIVPNSILYIDRYYFSKFNMEQIIIPNSVQYIGSNCFYGCENLIEITIPEGITRLESHLFSNCYNLTSVKLPKHLKEIGKSVFSECTSIESILIPESVTRISSGAFSNCKNLTLLDLSNVKIHKISKFMCCKCKNLKTVILPNTIKKISKYGFSGCSDLNSINLNSNVKLLDKSCFESAGLIQLELKHTHLKYICDNAFSNCYNLKSIELPDVLTYLGRDVFANCISLLNIQLGKNLHKLRNNVFLNCVQLSKINLSEIKEFRDTSFKCCQRIQTELQVLNTSNVTIKCSGPSCLNMFNKCNIMCD